MRKLLTLLSVLVASSAIGFAAQVLPSHPVAGTPVFLTYTIEGADSFNPDRVQKLSVKLIDKDGKAAPAEFELNGFEAIMPEHNHGMLTKAVIQKKSGAEFTVDGVKLHMPGKWILEFKVLDKAPKVYGAVQVIVPVKVPVEIK